ncbi:FAD-binding oxidoreductase [Cupriavidus sp. L7L]|uniref:NAD(P)/FAD-dependent oxidoreductase n=1 Tax=Cupriavidus sp. L7L TaxID=2546443 RepID=UPI001054DBED|nr:FAD-binding oxidoreductase [Cupriavidus sp. L7L]TDF62152.1 FAD-binding oxidoreductase [Cupriavidus sp. L7L]
MNQVTVVGAGIVGLATALQLRMDGFAVQIIDPNEPASGCSAGNAGYLSEANIFPSNSTESLKKLPALLKDPLGPLTIHASYIPRFLPWGIRAALALRPEQLSKTVEAMSALIRPAIESYDSLLREASASHLMERRGALAICKKLETLEARSAKIPALQQHHVAVERISKEQALELEPAISRDIQGALFYPNSGRCLGPRRLGEMFAQRLQEAGCRFIKASIHRMAPTAAGRWRLDSDIGSLDTDLVVVCAGRRSDALMRPLGYSAPLISERGYHLMLPMPSVSLGRPVSIAEAYFVATPMADGLRLAGTAEFAPADAPMNAARSDMLFKLATPYFPGLSREGAVRWMGVRPSLPDGLPAIGRASRHANLYYSFGHGHNGLTLAAVSAKLLASIVSGRKVPQIDSHPYAVERFSLWRREVA